MHPGRGPNGAPLVSKRQEGKRVTQVPESPKFMSYTGSESFVPSAVYNDFFQNSLNMPKTKVKRISMGKRSKTEF